MKTMPERLIERGEALASMRDYVTSAERIADECYLRTQRSRAIAYLGDKWRALPDCRHVCTNADGVRVDVPRGRVES